MKSPSRRFPPPWSIEDIGSAYIVKDSGRQKLAYIYYEEAVGDRRPRSAHPRRGAADAANVAKLPELLRRP